jgi:phosphoglycolate phosphatase
MAILFDLDGTLVNSADDMLNAMQALCLEIKKPLVDPKIFINNISFGVKKIFQEVWNMDINSIDKDYLQQLIDRFVTLYKQTNYQNSKLFPGGLALIKQLQQYKLKIGIVTNKPIEFAHKLLQRVDILKYLDCLVTPDMVTNPKPHPEPVLLAIQKLQVSADQCLFIGDSKQDIIAGKQAGVKTVAALFGYIGDVNAARNTWNADYVVDDFQQIWPLIKKIYKLG